MRRAMLLCAGLGTRLRPLTDELPKPLVPLGDRPLLGHVIDRLRQQGVDSVVANAHHLSDIFSMFIESLPIEARVIVEPKILGTAGGVRHALPLLGEPPLLVHNGDIVGDVPVRGLLERASDGGLWLAATPRTAGQGSLGLGVDGRVVRLRGETFGKEHQGADYVGVCALGADAVHDLPSEGCLIGDVALPRLRAGALVGAELFDGPWTDAGSLESYLDANLSWLAERGQASWVGDGAEVEASLSQSIVGAGARVVGRDAVKRSVIWPGATASAPLADAVVTTAGRVVQVR